MKRWQIFSLMGIFIVAAAVVTLKLATAPATSSTGPTGLPPERLLEQAKNAHRPILALFHSTTCVPCLEMERIVGEVRPEFDSQIVFIDVNVYDPQNLELCRSARIRVIPTTLLVDTSGETRVLQGVIPPDQLRAELRAIAVSPKDVSG